ncbi:PLP-dependent aminotransferase family protein [uncultured Treponema sp.]|uniref:MocR-like pyridoxine biosynthesis transcription factor PdxR n=1 Tax=uncultured Treponema sp. TaxID=162155 RepID=UPI0015BF3F09|nr:PLP-dependent aminotransferase family protein [uncultured Treponema sp.]
MDYEIIKTKKSPAYLQLYERLKADIVRGIFPYGSKLPSKRQMAAECGVSEITVRHAYSLLCDEGYLRSLERSGFFVDFKVEKGFARTEYAGQVLSLSEKSVGVFDCARGDGSTDGERHFPFSVMAKTVRYVLNFYAERILEKSENSGCFELREAIRLYLAQNKNICVKTDQIVIGSGAEYLYTLVARLLGCGRTFALEFPSYEKIEQVYRLLGIRCSLLPLGKDGIESEALAKTEASVIHVSPYRSFPTGITATVSKKYEYITWAKKPDRFIVEDDFESEFSVLNKPVETMFALSSDKNVIYINTFSKTISPALRIGYMVLPERLAEEFSEKLGFISCTVPVFDQLVLAELISGGSFERHINRIRRRKRKLVFRR